MSLAEPCWLLADNDQVKPECRAAAASLMSCLTGYPDEDAASQRLRV